MDFLRTLERLNLNKMRARYEFGEVIARGVQGAVYKCRDSITNEIVAIKKLPIGDKLEGVPAWMIREFSLARGVEHKNIISIRDVRIEEDFAYLIYEHMDMDLHKLIQKESKKRLKPQLIKNILYQILSGLSHCHSHSILHRGMKPENVQIDMDKGVVKIADYGLARAAGAHFNIPSAAVGRSYIAPEILLGSTQYSASADVWSVGCIFAEMVIGSPLFHEMPVMDMLFQIFRFFGVPNEQNWPGVSSLPRYKDVSESFPCSLKNDLAEVVTGLEPDGLNLLTRMLCLNPAERVSAQNALNDPYLKDAQKA